ncbi:hypothetical protein ABF55_09295 [Enterobacter asburiae]|nr:hypothetical protein YA44_00600 [Enterobacter asburiae]KLP45005.1 hypothetical protein ABF55_09295 [Enterobacter asburiae]
MKVIESGEIISVNDEGPADYMIKKMLLNRSNRIYLRKKRIIDSKINELNKIITDKMENLILYFNTEQVDNSKIKKDITLLIEIKKDFDMLLEQR